MKGLSAIFSAAQDPAAPRRIPTLDGARGIAAMVVVISHCANEGLFPAVLGNGGSDLGGLGKMGVHLFFVLSGFLMSYLYGDQPFGKADVRRYMVHRISRVLPLFYLIVLLSMLFGAHAGPVWLFDVSGTRWIESLLILHGYDVLWTIPVEVHYYVVFLLIWYVAQRYPAVIWISAGFAAQVILLIVARLTLSSQSFLPYWFHFFFIGTICGYLYRRHYTAIATAARQPAGQWLGWLVLVVSLLSPPELRRMLGVPMLPVFIDPISAGVPILIFLASLGNLGPFRYLSGTVFTWVGAVSYALYLVHKPVLYTLLPLARQGDIPVYLWGIAVIMLSLGVAALSTYFYERPAQNLLNAWSRRGQRTATANQQVS